VEQSPDNSQRRAEPNTDEYPACDVEIRRHVGKCEHRDEEERVLSERIGTKGWSGARNKALLRNCELGSVVLSAGIRVPVRWLEGSGKRLPYRAAAAHSIGNLEQDVESRPPDVVRLKRVGESVDRGFILLGEGAEEMIPEDEHRREVLVE